MTLPARDAASDWPLDGSRSVDGVEGADELGPIGGDNKPATHGGLWKCYSAIRRARRVNRRLTRPPTTGTAPTAAASATSRAPVTAASIATTAPAAMVATLARAEKVSVTARCRLDTTAPVATNPRTAAPSSTKPAGPPTSQPRALVPSDEPNHASPNAIRGKPGPATRDWEGIASLMRPLCPATPSRQLNCPPEPRQWHPHPDAAPAHVQRMRMSSLTCAWTPARARHCRGRDPDHAGGAWRLRSRQVELDDSQPDCPSQLGGAQVTAVGVRRLGPDATLASHRGEEQQGAGPVAGDALEGPGDLGDAGQVEQA